MPNSAVEDNLPKKELQQSRASGKHNGIRGEPTSNPKIDPLLSPAKGILLTPGTGTTRRKNVSFGVLESRCQNSLNENFMDPCEPQLEKESSGDGKGAGAPARSVSRQSTLTKTLVELARQKQSNSLKSDHSGAPAPEKAAVEIDTSQTRNPECMADITIDLNQPLSRSGQHWKAEYEQYHRRSNREMKKIIKHGQNVKSYAAKKDSEATNLGKKLHEELAKASAMETKVSKLASQLRNARTQGPEGESDQAKLISELAQQTALAIQYKQKADRYKFAILKQSPINESEDDQNADLDLDLEQPADSLDDAKMPLEVKFLQSELKNLQELFKVTEIHAAKLQAENDTLKRSLARVKEEMMSYEKRRQGREERLKDKESKQRAARVDCEARLAHLKLEHQHLLQTSHQKIEVNPAFDSQRALIDAPNEEQHGNPASPKPSSTPRSPRNHEENFEDHHTMELCVSPRRGRARKPAVDIWTLRGQGGDVEESQPVKDSTELPPSSVRHDTHKVLKVIDQNLVAEEQQPVSKTYVDLQHPLEQTPPKEPVSISLETDMPSAVQQTFNRTSINVSPHASMINPSFNTIDEQPVKGAYIKPSVATMGRSASITSRVGSRTCTLSSMRGSALPADRAAAAKARLARRSAEKENKRGNIVVLKYT